MANSGADTNGSQFFINATGGMSADWDYYQQGFDVYEQSPEAFTSTYGAWVDMDKVTDAVKKLYEEHGGNPTLDGYYSTTGRGHTVFAQVFEGMDQVYTLSQADTDDNDKPLEDMVIQSVENCPLRGGITSGAKKIAKSPRTHVWGISVSLCFRGLILLCLCQLVGKRHQAVVHMHVFHNGVRMLHGDVIMAEVPERADSQPIQLVRYRLYIDLGNTENGHQGAVLLVKSLYSGVIQNLMAADLSSDHVGRCIEYANQSEAQLLKGHVPGNGLAQVACPHQDAGMALLNAQDFFNLPHSWETL